MYIKLTRLDNSPIWLNAAFIVTIEPRKQGGSIVVPIGDGLDYDVREKPDEVLAMLEGAPAATVVPVPPPKSLAPTPDDISGESPTSVDADGVDSVDEMNVGAAENATGAKAEDAIVKTVEKPAESSTEDMAGKQIKRPVRAKVKNADDVFADVVPASRKRGSRAKSKKPGLADVQIERLVKMAPGSKKKLLNTLAAQFKVADAEAVVGSLVEKGVIALDQDKVIWR